MYSKSKLHLSWSKLELYNQCPLKYKYVYLLHLPIKKNEYLLFGIAMHQLLEQVYKEGVFDTWFYVEKWDKFFDNIAKDKEFEAISKSSKDWVKSQGNWMVRDFFETAKEYNLEKKAKAVEKRLKGKVKIKGIIYTLTGIADLIIENEDGEIILIDFKTGKPDDEHYRKQSTLYAELVRKQFGIKITKIGIWYLKSKEIKFFEITSKLRKETANYIMKIVEKLQTEKYPAKKNEYCKYCEFKKRCKNESKATS